MLKMNLRIADEGEDAQVHWLLIELVSDGGVVLDVDRFRWVKGTKRPIRNKYQMQFTETGEPKNWWDVLGLPPPGYKHDYMVEREANQFGYAKIARTAARHFLRRQGLIPRMVNWNPVSVDSGLSPSVTIGEEQAVLRRRIKGAMLRIDTGMEGVLERKNPHIGTVTTILTEVAGGETATVRNDTDTCQDDELIGATTATFSCYVRFPMDAITATDTASKVDFVITIDQDTGDGQQYDLAPYGVNGGGASDSDSCATKSDEADHDFRTPYLADNTVMATTGTKTIELGATAEADVALQFGVGGQFTVQITPDGLPGGEGNKFNRFEALDDAGTDEANLVVTHAAAAGGIVILRRRIEGI